MTLGVKQLMICFLGLLTVMVVMGLATGRNPRAKFPESYPQPMPALTPFPEMPTPYAQMPMPTPQLQEPKWQKEPAANSKQAPSPGPWKPSPPATDPPAVVLAPPKGSPPAKMLPFQEAHWQGLEVISLTKNLARIIGIPSDAKGVIVDDVTAPADMEGFIAGDLIISVGQVPTPGLESFIKATDRVRDRRRTEIRLMRNGQLYSLVLTAIHERLGTANGETAPMIKPGSRPPHGYKGACTQCHRIGANGQLAVDQGDLLTRGAPPIRADQTPPHRNRGVCTACHKIIQ
jgi:hypothetical protein